ALLRGYARSEPSELLQRAARALTDHPREPLRRRGEPQLKRAAAPGVGVGPRRGKVYAQERLAVPRGRVRFDAKVEGCQRLGADVVRDPGAGELLSGDYRIILHGAPLVSRTNRARAGWLPPSGRRGHTRAGVTLRPLPAPRPLRDGRGGLEDSSVQDRDVLSHRLVGSPVRALDYQEA